jgi:hypothetical protein
MSTLQFAFLPLVLSPLAICATWLGTGWAVAYFLFAITTFILLDAFAPPLVGVPKVSYPRVYDSFLLMQLPAAGALILALLMGLGADHPAAQWLNQYVGVPVAARHGLLDGIALGAACGFHLGTNFAVAHELMHRKGSLWGACSRFLLILVGDAQFQEAHLYGHHANLGTPRDPATARRGESLYHFVWRSTLGQWQEAYRFERKRLANRSGIAFLIRHRPLRGNLATLGLLLFALTEFGALAAVGYAVAIAVAKCMLENINYIQHYGLVRDANERVNANHSWDCTGRGSSLILFNLTRHSDHHQLPRKPFWELEHVSEGPQMAHGFIGTLCLALVPTLWFRYAHATLAEPVHGELRPAQPMNPSL